MKADQLLDFIASLTEELEKLAEKSGQQAVASALKKAGLEARARCTSKKQKAPTN
jgi:hypothetical protein